MTHDPLLWNDVVARLVERYGERFWENACDECGLRLGDRARGDAEWMPGADGYHILSETEEMYGREYPPPGRIRPLMARRNKNTEPEEATAVENSEQVYGEQPVEYGDATPEQSEVVEPTAEATEQPAEESKKVDVTNRTANLADEWLKGTKVRIATRGSDYVNQQGEVIGTVNKRGTNYLQVKLLVSGAGKLKAEEHQRIVDVRDTSVEVINEFTVQQEPAKPAETEAPVAEEATTV